MSNHQPGVDLGRGRVLDDYLQGDSHVSLLIRTDFTDDAAWQHTAAAAMAPVASGDDVFSAELVCIDNSAYRELALSDLRSRIAGGPLRFVFVADHVTIANGEHPILAVEVSGVDGPERSVRVLPGQVWAIENNVSLANMDFAEFIDAADEDGVFRGDTSASSLEAPVERRRLSLTKAEFVAIAERATSTDTLRLLADEARTLNFDHVSFIEADYPRLHSIHTESDYSTATTLIGYDEYLAATTRQGTAFVGHLPLLRGHWQFLLTPDTHELIAAMKYQVPAQ